MTVIWALDDSRSAQSGDEAAIKVLGTFRAVAGGAEVPLRAPARRVVAYLAVDGGGPLQRRRVAEALWPDRGPDVSRMNLRQAVASEHRLGGRLIDAGADALRLVSGVAVDFQRALTAAGEVLSCPDDDAGPRVDPSLFLEDLLPGWDEEWLVLERERFACLRLRCLEELSRRWLRRGEWELAASAASAVAAADPLRESTQILLARASIGQGNRAHAVREFRRYRDLAHNVLGVEPSSEYQSLIDELR